MQVEMQEREARSGGEDGRAWLAVADVPADETVFSWLRKRTGYDRAVRSVRPRVGLSGRLELELPGVEIDRLRDAAVEILALEGFRGWRHRDGESRSYGGLSLTWNPDHQERPDPHAATLGTPRNARSEFYWRSLEHHRDVRHSYFDTYGFRRRTPASRHGYLGEFLDRFARPLVRSRLGVIPGEAVDPDDAVYRETEGWHRDEPVFENLRLNVPLETDDNFVFEMQGEEPRHLSVGRAYSWDTHRPHRVLCRGRTRTTRIHLVLGFAPWFDYAPSLDAWRPNAFFGRVHPFDMLAEGLIGPHVRLATGVRS